MNLLHRKNREETERVFVSIYRLQSERRRL